MNIKALLKNIKYISKTSVNRWEVLVKLFWLYDIFGKLGIKRVRTFKFYFKYSESFGKIRLAVRNNKGSDAFIISEVFEHECYKLEIDNINHGLVIMDLGANAGFTTVYYSKIFSPAKIICIEPIPDNIDILKENLNINNINAVIYEAAISTNDGIIEMELSDKDYGHKVHNHDFGKNVGDKLLLVKSVSINTIIKEQSLQFIDILKIDIEGYEGILFESNVEWLGIVNAIIIEIHENVSVTKIIETLRKYSFTYFDQSNGNWVFRK